MKNRFKLLAAVHLFLIRNDQILLLRRYNTGYEDGNYSVPAGHIDGNESITKAMLREVEEEIGLTLSKTDLELAHVMHRNSIENTGKTEERIDFFFIAKTFHGEPVNNEPAKCDELLWFSIESLPENVIPYVRTAIESVKQKKVFSEFGW